MDCEGHLTDQLFMFDDAEKIHVSSNAVFLCFARYAEQGMQRTNSHIYLTSTRCPHLRFRGGRAPAFSLATSLTTPIPSTLTLFSVSLPPSFLIICSLA
jgi:hypothetical protein